MSESVETKRSCATCVLCLDHDLGYSNYTVTGHDYTCLASLNPALDELGDLQDHEKYNYDTRETDLSPALAEALDVALTCDRYRFGAPAKMDYEEEDIPRDEDERKEKVTPDFVKQHYTDDDEAAELIAISYGWVKP